MARWFGYEARAAAWEAYAAQLAQAAMKHLWDEERGFFVSGSQRQVSWTSQVWFVLAGVLDREANVWLLEQSIAEDPPIPMVTPYMFHYFIDALMENGLVDLALTYMKAYWGRIIRSGADTFWELYDPKDPYASPYGSQLVNSFCHAWSGTPAYFIRKYFQN